MSSENGAEPANPKEEQALSSNGSPNSSDESSTAGAPLVAALALARASAAAESDESWKRIVKLKSCDDEVIEVDFDVIKMSCTIEQMVRDLSNQESATGDEVTELEGVTGDILRKIICYCEYHKDDPPPPPPADFALTGEMPEKRSDDISKWDENFLNVEQTELFHILLAANFLQIKPLKDLCCKTIANMIKGCTPEEIRRKFGIRNDFNDADPPQTTSNSPGQTI